MNGKLIIISGPSGVGKGTICRKLVEKYPNYHLSISATTREKRPREQDGVHYHFLAKSAFEKLIAEDGLLEWAEYNGNFYGTPRAKVKDALEKGKNVILEIEVEGGRKAKEQFPEALMIFIAPPTPAELIKRLKRRGTETPEQIEKRLRRAEDEYAQIPHYDFTIINDNLHTTVQELHERIQGGKRNAE